MKRVAAAMAIALVVCGTVRAEGPYTIVLGIAQDGGAPQAGTKPSSRSQIERLVVSLAVVDPRTSSRWLIDCTPDFPEQLLALDEVMPVDERPGLAGIFITHAHMGHYTGLMYLGHEVMGAHGVPVYVMPVMGDYLRNNGPWSQLIGYDNIEIRPLEADVAVALAPDLRIVPFRVPHRQEYSEVVGYRIDGPNRSVLFIPDIDSWDDWDASGTRVESLLATVDVAYLDGTFFSDGEIPGRDMSGFPHPMIATSMERFGTLPASQRAKIRFIHLNHTNPALRRDSEAWATITANGFFVAEELERVDL